MVLGNEPTSLALAYHLVVYCENIAAYTGGRDIINRPVIAQFDCITEDSLFKVEAHLTKEEYRQLN